MGKKRMDRVVNEVHYVVPGEVPQFVVDMDVRRNITITFVDDTEFYAGEKVIIDTSELQKDIVKEYKQEQKRLLNHK